MAASQKKTGGKRTSSGGTRRSGSASGSSRGNSRGSKAPARRPMRREIGAAVCLALALFAALGYFHIQAIFIDFFSGLLKGLLGYGFWLMPPALLLAAYILAFHRGRPVRLRVTCALLLPLLFSCIVHGLLGRVLPWDAALVKTLWAAGEELTSGGVLGGVLAQGSVQVFSRLGSTILFVLAFLLAGLGAFRLSLAEVADWIFDRPRYEYEPEEEPERPRRSKREERPAAPEPVRTPSRRADIDIPVEDGPLVGKTAQTAPEVKKKGSFFNRKANVPAPDQVLAGAEQRTAEQPAPAPEPAAEPAQAELVRQAPEPAPAPVPSVPSVPPAPPAAPLSGESPREPEPAKVSREEARQAAQEVARDVQSRMAEAGEHPYQYPPLSLLKEGPGDIGGEALVELNANRQRLDDTIHSFGIDANIVNVTRGPSVTRYELELDQGVRLNKLTNLADDIALALGASGVRIAPIPDQISMVGIEVPNKLVSPVNIHSVIGSREFTDSPSKVSFAVGKDIGGHCIVGNIAKLPHLLIAGTTGSGKSVCTNSLIISLLYKATPDEVRLIMVDPKMVELGIYNGIPHLLIPVVTDPKKAAGALQWAVTEMMKRYRTFAEVGVRDLAAYNALAARTEGMTKMPQIVVVIDELADLMLVAAKEVEESICRVAQMGRAAGMHLVIATQRPSADVITGLMKANIPSRIAFAVASSLESRIILDNTGAEKLVGKGDMLWFPLGSGKPLRVQGCFISDEEVAAVVDSVKQNAAAEYDDEVMAQIEQHVTESEKKGKSAGGAFPAGEAGEEEQDELFPAGVDVILDLGQASVSLLQRRLKLGYARAARLMDQMEEKGIVGPSEGSKPRQILITKDQWVQMQSGGDPTPPEAAPPVEEEILTFDPVPPHYEE